jgi:putative ABC transport system ATP-binding protein
MLVLRDVAKVFHKGGPDEVTALAGISLDIDTGDFITVIGSNGAGKSTLLNCLAGCPPPDSGSIVLDGADITPCPNTPGRFLGRSSRTPCAAPAPP